jgi:hypothetical protein
MVVQKSEFVGKKFGVVGHQQRNICGQGRYSLAIMEPDSPANIDVNVDRMNVYVDENFVIKDIRFG